MTAADDATFRALTAEIEIDLSNYNPEKARADDMAEHESYFGCDDEIPHEIADVTLPADFGTWNDHQRENWAWADDSVPLYVARRRRTLLNDWEHQQRGGPQPTKPLEAVELFIDLAALDPSKVVQATIGARDDGVMLLYSGAVNGLIGDPEHGKSLIATALSIRAAQDGGTVVWLDLDHNGAQAFRGRLESLGGGHLLERFKFAQPEDKEGVLAVVQWVIDNQATMFVVDSIGELLPMFGASSDSSDDYTRVNRAVAANAARSGSCVLTIDHLAKNSESRAFGSAGTIAKKRAIDGALYRVEAPKGFAPGRGGEALLKNMKDRHGSVKSRLDPGREPAAARFVIEANGSWSFTAPSPKVDPLAADIAALALLNPPSQREARRQLRWGAERVRKAWDAWSS